MLTSDSPKLCWSASDVNSMVWDANSQRRVRCCQYCYTSGGIGFLWSRQGWEAAVVDHALWPMQAYRQKSLVWSSSSSCWLFQLSLELTRTEYASEAGVGGALCRLDEPVNFNSGKGTTFCTGKLNWKKLGVDKILTLKYSFWEINLNKRDQFTIN